jgi:hypothetical protein
MSSSFSAHEFDDRPLSVTSTHYQSFIDLSPSSNYHTHTHHSSRISHASVGSENSTTPLHPQRSSIRIDTNLTVRKCVSNSLSPTPPYQFDVPPPFPSLAPTRETATANHTQTRLAASQKCCVVIAHTLHFHLRSSDSCRDKSARKTRRLGSLARPSSDDKSSSPARASGTREKNSKVDAVAGRGAVSAGCHPLRVAGKSFWGRASSLGRAPLAPSKLGISAKRAINRPC